MIYNILYIYDVYIYIHDIYFMVDINICNFMSTEEEHVNLVVELWT